MKNEKRERGTVIKGKIVPKDVGNPNALLTLPETVQKLELGKIYGSVFRTGTRTMSNGDSFQFLEGSFKAVPFDEGMDIVTSGMLYMPSGIHEMIASSVDKLQDGASLDFAFTLFVQRATNPRGYSWAAMSLFEPTANDAFTAIENRIAGRKIAQLAAAKA